MKDKTKYILGGLVILVAGVIFTAGIVELRNLEKEYRQLFDKNTRVFTPEVPKQAAFAGEKVPLANELVIESFDREILANTFLHASTIMMFKRANRYFPAIEPVLKRNGVPDDFKFLALAESNFANVVSPSGAEGFWQFLKATGQKYGLEITEEVDERYNVEKATEAACKYFQEAFAKWNSWTTAAASYNRGLDGMTKALENQKVSNFYELYLNEETARYVFRILALKEIYYHPVKYGYYLRPADFYPVVPTYSVTVDSTIEDLADFAFKQKTTYRVLREFNPWIRRYNLPNKSGKTYTFILPKDESLKYENLLKLMPESETFFHDSLKINQIH
jgi:membrane-bound lytic murein transglycosylase D